MKLEIQTTGDGSQTLYRPDIDETYHSSHGALTESQHVFLKEGLQFQWQQHGQHVRILEVGLGTGLNALLTLAFCQENPGVIVEYVGLEPLPPSWDVLSQLQYPELLPEATRPFFKRMHQAEWEVNHDWLPNFSFVKTQQKLEEYSTDTSPFHVVYFDAFAPRKQAEMWEIFQMERCFALTQPGGCLVTYCAMGQFRRNLKAAGYTVAKIPGPPGKREMTRAIKSI